MTYSKVPLLLVLTTFLFTHEITATRSFSPTQDRLNVRLETKAGLYDCWNALMELRSCTKEIIGFLVNGQTNLGTGCCKGISIITHNCWPEMLSSLGFTVEEGIILTGYCDKANSGPAVSPANSGLEINKGNNGY